MRKRGDPIPRSIRAYRRAHATYERDHTEIFNEKEQSRLRKELEYALDTVDMRGMRRRALDIGCGTGNVTRHLVDLGASAVAADVSPDFLRVVDDRYGQSQVTTALLNGHDLREFDDQSFDLVTAYSVLHHVPDYLGLVREALRVLKPGGVLYIDHEVNQLFWVPDECLKEFHMALAAVRLRDRGFWNPDQRHWQRFLIPLNYATRLRLLAQPRYQPEGDIHVFPDDHIEWKEIEQVLSECGAKVVRHHEYLVYREGYPMDVYQRFADAGCADMALMIAQKRIQSPV
jgi:ubiquinone/menaquinone biosynthesis C-methylase UbiE